MYPPHHLGGYELMWRAGATALRDRGHAVRILTTDYRSAAVEDPPSEDPDVHRELRWYWRDHEFPRLGFRERVRLERHNGRVLDRHLAEHSPDVVTWWAMGGMSLSLIERVRRRGLPAVGFVHDDWMIYGPKVDQWARMLRRFPDFGRAGRWLFVSEQTRRRALEAGHELPSTGVLHSGVELADFEPASPRTWGWQLLYMGRIDPRKGVETAVRALEHLPPEATLTISGSGEPGYARQLARRARQLGVADRVHFTRADGPGRARLYAEADAVLFPTLWEEPWGLVPLEAMATGRPVVATGTGGSREYLRDGENCLLFSPTESAQALAGAVRRLAGDAELVAGLRERGRRTAERHSSSAFAAGVVDAVEGEA
jgi:glycosyltransferase involved in cell wall biosynthesis